MLSARWDPKTWESGCTKDFREKAHLPLFWTQRGIRRSRQEEDEQEKEGIGEIRKENGFGAGSYMMWLTKRSLERRNRPLCLL